MPRGEVFRIHEPHVIYQSFDQELIAIHMTTGAYHSLPGTAGEVFQILAGDGTSVAEAAAHLLRKYEAPVESIERDLEQFFSQLRAHDLIIPAKATRPPVVISEPDGARLPYSPPKVESFNDLDDLFLIDPVHDVSDAGWPAAGPSRMPQHGTDLAVVRCRLAGPHIIHERFDDEIVAINLNSQAYYSLSGSAEEIFELLSHNPTSSEIRKALTSRYHATQPEFDLALREFLNELAAAGLVVLDAANGEIPIRELALNGGSHQDRTVPFPRPVLQAFTGQSMDASTKSGRRSADFEAFGKRYVLRRGSDVLLGSGGSATIVIDRDQGHSFVVNQPARDALERLKSGCSAGELAASLERKYAATAEELRAAILTLLSNLSKIGLIEAAQADDSDSKDPAPEHESEILPFPGFELTIHREIEESLRPFHPSVRTTPEPDEGKVRDFSRMLSECFADSANGADVTEASYAIGGRVVKIHSVGRCSLAHRAFAHLTAANDRGADLTIYAWGCSVPAPPQLARIYEDWPEMCGPRGEVLGIHGPEMTAIYEPGPEILSVYHVRDRAGYYVARDDRAASLWDLRSPFRHILHRWFAAEGLQFAHAGAIGLEGGVLLAGNSGSAKSGAAVLSLAAGFHCAGASDCLVDTESLRVFSLYGTAKLEEAGLRSLPALRDRTIDLNAVALADLWPGQIASSFPLRGILLPALTEQHDSSLEPCSSSDALLALLPSTLAQVPGAGQADCDRLALLAERLPVYRLHLGTDFQQIPPLIRQALG